MSSRDWQLAEASATERLGAALARAVGGSGAVITFSGELGTGKTTLVRGFLHGLGHVGRVRSPTYTLVEPYELSGRQVLHCDLYRLKTPTEFEDLGLRDLQDGGILLIEWPEKGGDLLPSVDLALTLTYEGDGRAIMAQALTSHGTTILGAMPEAGHFI